MVSGGSPGASVESLRSQHKEWSAAAASNRCRSSGALPAAEPLDSCRRARRWPCGRIRSLWRFRLGLGGDHGPGIGGADGLSHAMEEALLRVIVLPAPAVVELD